MCSSILKKSSTLHPSSSYSCLYSNPLNDIKDSLDGFHKQDDFAVDPVSDDKENVGPNMAQKPSLGEKSAKNVSGTRSKLLKPSSLQFCMQKNDPDSSFGPKSWDAIDSDNPNSLNIWDFSDSEAAPASAWSTLPNRSLLCRPLPVDIGRCSCLIVKETSSASGVGGSLFALYTYEGQGRQNRKLAMAYHTRRMGRSVFMVAQNNKGLLSNLDESFIGSVTSNFIGSKYCIWNQGNCSNSPAKYPKQLLASVVFDPTITTWFGRCRSMRAWVPKHQSMQLKNKTQIQHISGLPADWEDKTDRVHQLFSRVPQYNKITKQRELDFRDRGRAGLKVQRSVKNFQLTLEKNGKQTILQLGRVSKSKYVIDFR